MIKKGFTLVELVVVIAVVAILSGIILFSVSQYINKGKDSNIAGILATLIPAGEVFYNGSGVNSYDGFCNQEQNSVIKNAILQMPANPSGKCYAENNSAGLCCGVESSGQAWAACATKFTDQSSAFCVDSRGLRRKIENSACSNEIYECQ